KILELAVDFHHLLLTMTALTQGLAPKFAARHRKGKARGPFRQEVSLLGGNGWNRLDMRKSFAMASVGIEMVIPILIGNYLDSRFGWQPWGVLVGAVVGFTGA